MQARAPRTQKENRPGDGADLGAGAGEVVGEALGHGGHVAGVRALIASERAPVVGTDGEVDRAGAAVQVTVADGGVDLAQHGQGGLGGAGAVDDGDAGLLLHLAGPVVR